MEANYKRPDLSYLSQAKTQSWGFTSDKFECIAFYNQEGKLQGSFTQSENFKGVIENIPGLVQVAEMYFDSMGSSMEGTLPYEMTKEVLERLKQ